MPHSPPKHRPPHSPRLAILIAAGAAALATASAGAQVEYGFFLVEPFNTTSTTSEAYITEINNLNIATGWATATSSTSGLIWKESTGKSPIPVTAPKGLNNSGIVVDNDFVYDTITASSTTVPGLPGHAVPRLRDVNDNGIVVGEGWSGTPCSLVTCYAPLIWDAAGGTRTITNVPSARWLTRINDHDVVLGHIARTNTDRTEAFIYDLNTGTWTNLSDSLPPHWLVGYALTEAVDISNSGAVTGRAQFGQEAPQAFLWSQSIGYTFLPGLHGGDVDRVHPGGVNSSNTIVGRAMDGNNVWRAFIWQPELGMRDLNTLAALPPNFILEGANKINDNGWIVGYGRFGPGWATSRGFILKPINQSQSCYANCDQSTVEPALNVDDFTCFINQYAAAQQLPHAQQVEHYVNCDDSTIAPALNVDDFTCFINQYAQGCP